MSHNPYSNTPTPPQNVPASSAKQAKSKLFAPGLALTIVGGVGLVLMGIYAALTLIAVATGAPGTEPPPEMVDEAERAGFYVGAYGVVVLFCLNALLQIVVILGGVAMMKAKGRGVAYAACVLSVVPCLGSSLCFLGIPFGIWGLIVLSDPNVKRIFK